MVKPHFSAVWAVDFIDSYLLNCHHDLCGALYNVMEIYIHINLFPPLPPYPPTRINPFFPPTLAQQTRSAARRFSPSQSALMQGRSQGGPGGPTGPRAPLFGEPP